MAPSAVCELRGAANTGTRGGSGNGGSPRCVHPPTDVRRHNTAGERLHGLKGRGPSWPAWQHIGCPPRAFPSRECPRQLCDTRVFSCVTCFAAQDELNRARVMRARARASAPHWTTVLLAALPLSLAAFALILQVCRACGVNCALRDSGLSTSGAKFSLITTLSTTNSSAACTECQTSDSATWASKTS